MVALTALFPMAQKPHSYSVWMAMVQDTLFFNFKSRRWFIYKMSERKICWFFFRRWNVGTTLPSVIGHLSVECIPVARRFDSVSDPCSISEKDTLVLFALKCSDWLGLESHDQEGSRVKGPRSCPLNYLCSVCARQETKRGDNGLRLDRGWGYVDPFPHRKALQAENQNGKGDLVSCPNS